MKTYELTIKENYNDNSTVALKATVIMLADLTDDQVTYLNLNQAAGSSTLRSQLSCYEQQAEATANGLLMMIRTYLDQHHELEFEDGTNLTCADEEMEMIYKAEGRYYLETTINASGEDWTYELNETDLVTIEDLLWVGEQIAYDKDFIKGE